MPRHLEDNRITTWASPQATIKDRGKKDNQGLHTDNQLASHAREARVRALWMIARAQSGHPGGCLSALDILTVLWFELLSYRGNDAGELSRVDDNRFVLSKGHSVPAIYALASMTGQIDRAELSSFRQIGSRLQGHPSSLHLPWLETSTGSLGQGFAFAAGLALAKKISNEAGEVFVLLGDGELQEGQVWETAMFASHHGLNNLVAIVDRNNLQSDSDTETTIALEPLEARFQSFGWETEVGDGHSFVSIRQFLRPPQGTKPKVVLANTIKGKGIDFMEGAPEWHGSVAMTADQLRTSFEELGLQESRIENLTTAEGPFRE